jgi:hypothetical protein
MSSPEKLLYLATPYTHPDPQIMRQRFELACIIAGELMKKGHYVFSPIAHSHPIALHSTLGGAWAQWQDFCTLMVNRCDQLGIVTLSGWSKSVGIAEEAAIAAHLGKPTFLIDPDSLEFSLYGAIAIHPKSLEAIAK